MTHHGMSHLPGLGHFCNYTNDQDLVENRFGRMFHHLPAVYNDPAVLKHLGSSGGPMDGGSGSNRTKSVPVGHVFFGQFVDHDVTLDVTSSLTGVNDPTGIVNVRTPTLDLDCIYGDGPEASPYLYKNGIRLLTGADGTGVTQDAALAKEDLQRVSTGTAIIGDPRNDENRIISQIQLGMIRFHNRVCDSLASKYHGHELYVEARRIVTWHYHWAILHDFLPAMCGGAVVWDILHQGRDVYCALDNVTYIPVEFSVAAYRFGHSMAPQEIQVQKGDSAFALFGTVFGRGFSPLGDKRAVVDFHEIFHTSENRQVQMAEKMDTKLAHTLLDLPFITEGISSLATRNLLRGQSFLLPSGETVAAAMGRPEGEIDTVSSKADHLSGGKLSGKTPLWFYILAEAEFIGRETKPGHFDKAEGLGPVGARIVAEVLIGLMELDPRSFLAVNRAWTPEDGLGADVTGVGDMLTWGT